MPMLDAYIPQGVLTPEAERELAAALTELLLEHEGADPANQAARDLAWVSVHRPETVYVAGAPSDAPRYRFVTSVPEGQFTPERRAAMVATITEAVLDAEGGAHPRDPERVWVFTPEIPEGTWGGGGQIATLADIAGRVIGDRELGRRYAEATLAARRGEPVPS
jgi:phenylpyruvate tautomerase PptA (4-oxalocrotonate tautomerase family)